MQVSELVELTICVKSELSLQLHQCQHCGEAFDKWSDFMLNCALPARMYQKLA